jgi:hypothetical protein
LKDWIENHFYDFEDDSKLFEELLSFLLVIAQSMNNTSVTNGVQFWVSKLQKLVEQKILEAAVSLTFRSLFTKSLFAEKRK